MKEGDCLILADIGEKRINTKKEEEFNHEKHEIHERKRRSKRA